MDSVVIVSSKRTPLGAFCGKFSNVKTQELGATVIKKVTADLDANVSDVYMGCVLSAGLGQSAARQSAISAGLGYSVHCININKICGSGMSAIMSARNAILARESEIVVAGGMENMSRAPYFLQKARTGYRLGDGALVDHMIYDGLTDAYGDCHMGLYADKTAELYGFSREAQDEYTLGSFNKARRAVDDNLFASEIAPVSVKDKKGAITVVDVDEVPFSVDLQKMPKLRPAFRPEGTITAASASSISDGAAAVLMMSEKIAQKEKMEIEARIVAQSSFSQDPKLFALAPIGAVKQLLAKTGWSVNDVDVWEINEAFAIVAMAAIKDLDIAPEKVNIFGGACALGHPLGASGARIVVTLINAMKSRKAKKGVATLCVGGGEGVAIALEM